MPARPPGANATCFAGKLTVRCEWEVPGRTCLDGRVLVVGPGFAARQPEG